MIKPNIGGIDRRMLAGAAEFGGVEGLFNKLAECLFDLDRVQGRFDLSEQVGQSRFKQRATATSKDVS